MDYVAWMIFLVLTNVLANKALLVLLAEFQPLLPPLLLLQQKVTHAYHRHALTMAFAFRLLIHINAYVYQIFLVPHVKSKFKKIKQ